MALELTVADYIAHLSQFPSDTKILASVGAPGQVIEPGHLCFQQNCPNGVLDNLMITIWANEDGDGAEFSSGAGEVKPLERLSLEHYEVTGDEFVAVTVSNDSTLPVNANPFHYDSWSMGTPLVRGWTIMHEGFDREEDPKGLLGMVLHNARSGQRIRLRFHPVETPAGLAITCPQCRDADNEVSQDGKLRICARCGFDISAYAEQIAPKKPVPKDPEITDLPQWAQDILKIVGQHHHFGTDVLLAGDEGHMIYSGQANLIRDALLNQGYVREPAEVGQGAAYLVKGERYGLYISYMPHGENGMRCNVSWYNAPFVNCD